MEYFDKILKKEVKVPPTKPKPIKISELNLAQGQKITCSVTGFGNKDKHIKDSMVYKEDGHVYLLQNECAGAQPRRKNLRDICAKYGIEFACSWSLGYEDGYVDPTISNLPIAFKANTEFININSEAKIFVDAYFENSDVIFFKDEKGNICKMDDVRNLGVNFFSPKNYNSKNHTVNFYEEDFFELMKFRGKKSKNTKKALADLLARANRWGGDEVQAEVPRPGVGEVRIIHRGLARRAQAEVNPFIVQDAFPVDNGERAQVRDGHIPMGNIPRIENGMIFWDPNPAPLVEGNVVPNANELGGIEGWEWREPNLANARQMINVIAADAFEEPDIPDNADMGQEPQGDWLEEDDEDGFF